VGLVQTSKSSVWYQYMFRCAISCVKLKFREWIVLVRGNRPLDSAPYFREIYQNFSNL